MARKVQVDKALEDAEALWLETEEKLAAAQQD
jgi:ATP-binding cassette subfamily F protein 3